jgi:uncharacterized membrane protein YagU involved in acid resistance
MNIVAAIVAGLVSTLAMTILMMLAPKMGMPKMDIVETIGTMFTSNAAAARPIGLVIHFMMGAVFAIIYAALWMAGIGSVSIVWGVVFGIIHAILVAGIGMPMMLRMHPRPPKTEGSAPMRAMGMVLGHVVFGIVVVLVYTAFV